MGRWTSGHLTQKFKIQIDTEKLREFIEDQVKKAIESEKAFTDVEIDESYYEDDDLVIDGSYGTDYKSWYCRATLECPEEHEVEREYIGKDNWILSDLPENIRELVKVSKVVEDEEDVIPDEEW